MENNLNVNLSVWTLSKEPGYRSLKCESMFITSNRLKKLNMGAKTSVRIFLAVLYKKI